MLTTENQRQDLARLRELDVSAHLVKPIGAADLADALGLAEGGAAGGLSLAPFDLDLEQPDSGQSLRILLVEDNPVNQELAVRLLERNSHHVVVANNGAEAVEQFDSAQFDIILMDMQMPVMGGIEATEAIRAREMRRSWVISHELRQVYIIAMTANVMASDRERCLEAGMNDYLAKPLRPEQLTAALARAGEASGNGQLLDADFAPLPEAGRLDLKAAQSDIGDIELFATMVSMLLAEWGNHLGRLNQALVAADAQSLRIHAHTLKSLLAMFHAELARRLAMDLEKAAMAVERVDWPACQRLYGELADEMERICPLLKRFVDTRVIP